MPDNIPNSTNSPMAEYLLKLQLIVSNTEFKDRAEALKYETIESSLAGDQYVHAMNHTDSFESYTYDSKTVYDMLSSLGLKDQRIMKYINNPTIIPQAIKSILMEDARARCIAEYVEENKYYVMLTGKPFQGNKDVPADPVLTIPDEFFEIYKGDESIFRDQPIHEMPEKYQELFMNTDWYKQMLLDYPDARYLRYIGTNSIPIEVSRSTRDGDIMKINTTKLSTYHQIFGNVVVSPDIIHKFVNVYRQTRDYVYGIVRGDFSAIYANYDSFIRFLTIYLAIGNTMNEFMKSAAGYIHMNNITANNLFMLYGLPSVIMEGTSMINFLKKFRLLLMDKGTNIVYRVKDLIGYKYTDIYTLVMVKQQRFENGVPIYKDGKPVQDIYFRRLGTTEDNTSYFKFRESREEYPWQDIADGDHRWWNSPEVEEMLRDMNYTLSNSKYIQLSTHVSMTDIWWQCVIMLRGLLDNNSETRFTKINVNYNINGSNEMTVFDAVLTLVILMNYQMVDKFGNRARGNLYYPNGTYNGKAACIDMLFDGLNLAQRYEPSADYKEGDVIGYRLDELYEATEDFVSYNLEDDIRNGHLIPYEGTWHEGSPKELVPGRPFKVASFNFNIRNEDPQYFMSLEYDDYLGGKSFQTMVNNVLDRHESNIGIALMDDVSAIYNYLEKKLQEAYTIQQFRQVTDAYNKLFLVDPLRHWDSGLTDNTDDMLKTEYGMSDYEYEQLKSFFDIELGNPDLTVVYKDMAYPIYLNTILNMSAYNIPINKDENDNDIYPFRDDGFIDKFNEEMRNFVSIELEKSAISRVIKKNYQNIIIDKVAYDSSNTSYGPRSFEALLRTSNVDLYKYLKGVIDEGDSKIALLIRAIIKALEDYVNSPLSGLEFSALGVDNYIRILKEVITYFKSYMVEFTKDEFMYIFDGLFDNGGNSNMLNLYDEMSSGEYLGVPKDSLSLFDVSTATIIAGFKDGNPNPMLYDECLFAYEGTFRSFINSGYELLFDDGTSITHHPFDEFQDDTIVTGNVVYDKASSAYKIVFNRTNIKPQRQYYGNVPPSH